MSDRLLLCRNTLRNFSDWEKADFKVDLLKKITAHEKTEKKIRTRMTSWTTKFASIISFRKFIGASSKISICLG